VKDIVDRQDTITGLEAVRAMEASTKMGIEALMQADGAFPHRAGL
jgi:hypothetical protein